LTIQRGGQIAMPQPDRSSETRPQPSSAAPRAPKNGGAEAPKTGGGAEPTVSKPGGFKNDPDDPKNPNEAIERHRRKLRRKGPA